jgi:hypothetical protein
MTLISSASGIEEGFVNEEAPDIRAFYPIRYPAIARGAKSILGWD